MSPTDPDAALVERVATAIDNQMMSDENGSYAIARAAIAEMRDGEAGRKALYALNEAELEALWKEDPVALALRLWSAAEKMNAATAFVRAMAKVPAATPERPETGIPVSTKLVLERCRLLIMGMEHRPDGLLDELDSALGRAPKAQVAP